MFFKIIKHSKKAGAAASASALASDHSHEESKDSGSPKWYYKALNVYSRARLGLLKSKINTPAYTFYTSSGSLPGLLPTVAPDITNHPMQLVMADIYHLAEIIEKYKESVPNEENPLYKYLNLPKDQITIMTSGAANQLKISGHPKNLTLELHQKDTTIKYAL